MRPNHRAQTKDTSDSDTPVAILYTNASAEMHGAEQQLMHLITRLNPAEFTPQVVLPANGPLLRLLAARSVRADVLRLAVLQSRKELYSPKLLAALARLLPSALALARRMQADGVRVVHSNSSAVIDGAVAARLAGIPHVWHVRELLHGPAPVVGPLRMAITGLSDCVICISSAVCEQFSARDGRFRIIPSGIDTNETVPASAKVRARWRHVWGFPMHAVVVGMVGRINYWKGQGDLLTAAISLCQEYENVFFIFIGDTPEPYRDVLRTYQRQIDLVSLNHRIRFVGGLPHDQVLSAMAAFDILAVPSLSEGLSITLLEGMAAGVPAVATRGGPSDVVVEGETGFLVAPQAPVQLQEALDRLLSNPGLRRRMGSAARERILAHFTADTYARRVSDVYREILTVNGVREAL